MKFKVVKPVDLDIKYLDVYFGERVCPEDIQIGNKEYESWDEILKDYPQLVGNINGELEFFIRIDVENGKVINWVKDAYGDLRDIKVVDEGTYILLDEKLNELKRHDYCYVPDCLSIESEGYGDYFEFTISKDGKINNWKFTQDDVDEMYEINKDED